MVIKNKLFFALVKSKHPFPAIFSRTIIAGNLLAFSSISHAVLPDNGWIYDLKNVNSQLCVNASSDTASTTAIADAVQLFCSGANNQRWQLLLNADNTSYRLVNQGATNTCLTVAGASTANGAAISRAACGQAGQNWKLVEKDQGYQLLATHSNKCMVVSNASSAVSASLIQYDCNGGQNEKFLMKKFLHASNDAASSGQWGPVQKFGLVPAAAAVLPSGQLLYWSASGTHIFHQGTTQTHTGLLNLNSGAFTETTVETGQEMFCPATAMTAEGRVLVAGGGGDQTKRKVVNSYDYKTNQWIRESPLTVPRWYSTALTLSDGAVFTVGGDTDGADPLNQQRTRYGDLWRSATPTSASSWSTLSGITESPDTNPPNRYTNDGGYDYGMARAQYYRKLVSAPDGRILEMAPTPFMRWHSVNGDGLSVAAGSRGADYTQGAMTAQYAVNKVLLAGGSIAFGDEDASKDVAKYPALTKAYSIDLNSGTASAVPEMRFPRYQGNSVVMPDGKVFAVGGAGLSALFDNKSAIFASEIFNPANNTWDDMAPMKTPRMYHAVALLLPDARIWVAGGGLCNADCPVNHADAEIFSPPYLFKDNNLYPRPAISAAPASVTYGSAINVTASANVDRFTLIRMSSVTHSTNTDQRLVEAPIVLAASNTANGTYSLAAPANGKLAPPGFYMLFAIKGGVPSISKIVKIGNTL